MLKPVYRKHFSCSMNISLARRRSWIDIRQVKARQMDLSSISYMLCLMILNMHDSNQFIFD